jgi:hypothetical protein
LSRRTFGGPIRHEIPKPKSQIPNQNRGVGFLGIWVLGFGVWDLK